MTDNNFQPGISKHVARRLGLAKLSPEDAQAKFDATPTNLTPMSDSRIHEIVRLATSNREKTSENVNDQYWEKVAPMNVEEETLVLNRNPGGNHEQVDSLLDSLRSEALGVLPAPKSRLDAQSERNLIERAADQAEEFISALGIKQAPVDPFIIAESERPQLIVKSGGFGDLFDGQLEYHSSHKRFLLFVNSKYDVDRGAQDHHPRTRFSLAHELAHYYLEDHRRYLVSGGKIHRSRGEFFNEQQREREADAFAAALLMPRQLIEAEINQCEPDLDAILDLAARFQTSILSMALRAVQLSHFPCALVAVRGGTHAWTRCSDSMIQAGCYPGERGALRSDEAVKAWKRFEAGRGERSSSEGFVRDWFRTFNRRELDRISVAQHFVGIPSMRTLIAVLSIEERDLFGDDED